MTSYIFNIPVFKQTNFIIFYYYNFHGEGRVTDKTILCGAGCKSVCRTQNVQIKLNPCIFICIIDADGRSIVIIMENKKFPHGLVVIVYFARAIHKKILIRRSTIVLLPNAFLGSTEAPQLPPQKGGSL